MKVGEKGEREEQNRIKMMASSCDRLRVGKVSSDINENYLQYLDDYHFQCKESWRETQNSFPLQYIAKY